MNRPEEIEERRDNVLQIEGIVATLRALAVAHQAEARTHLDAIRAHETSVASALSTALSRLDADRPQPADGPGVAIVIGAAQGFSGAFGERMATAALTEGANGGVLMVVGNRTLGALAEHKVTPAWSAEMSPHAPEVPALANRLADALFERLTATPDATVSLLFADPADPGLPLVRRTLFPFDFSRFPRASGAPPLTTLPAPALIAALVEEYVFTELCEALMLGFAAENAARAEAMSRAQLNVKRIAADLKGEFQRARQEQMTTEIVELSASAPPP